MLDYNFHMTLRSIKHHIFRVKTLKFYHILHYVIMESVT